MRFGFHKLAVLAAVVILPTYASSKDIYVAETIHGDGSGVDGANARPVSWFNDIANWSGGASGIAPGDTVRLVGNFTLALRTQGNGSQGNPIVIHGETGSTFKAPVLPSGGVMNIANDYVIVEN